MLLSDQIFVYSWAGQRLLEDMKQWHNETNRNLRLRELLHDHSGNSSLIVMYVD